MSSFFPFDICTMSYQVQVISSRANNPNRGYVHYLLALTLRLAKNLVFVFIAKNLVFACMTKMKINPENAMNFQFLQSVWRGMPYQRTAFSFIGVLCAASFHSSSREVFRAFFAHTKSLLTQFGEIRGA